MNDNEILYVAYGSNINTDQMKFRCPEAKIYDSGMIRGYELNFNKVATLIEKEGEQTPALVWTLSESDEKSLDKFEGYPHKYKKIYVNVTTDDGIIKGMAYVMNNSSSLNIPKDDYYNRIENGYLEMGFPLKYLEKAYDRAVTESEKRFEIDYDYDQLSFFEDEYRTSVRKTESNRKLINSFRLGIAYAQEFCEYGNDHLTDNEILSLIEAYPDLSEFDRAVQDIKNEYNTDNYYAAYGSNLNLSQMKHRCPNSEVIGVGELKGYELQFNSCATIRQNSQESTPVLIWRIHPYDWQSLDSYEGYPSYYRKETVTVSIGNIEHSARVYIMNSDSNKLSPPSFSYYNGIVEGYKQNGMDLRPLQRAYNNSFNNYKSQPKSRRK